MPHQRLNALLSCFALLVLLLSTGALAKTTVPVEAEYILDAEGTLSFEDIRAKPARAWTAAPDQTVSLSFLDPNYWRATMNGVLWLRVEMPTKTTLNRLWLELLPNTGISGKAIQFSDNQWQWLHPVGYDSGSAFYQPARYLTFILNTEAAEERAVYFRLTTDQVFEFSIRATPAEGLLWHLVKSQLFTGTVIGMLILAMCYNLAIGLRAREPVYVAYGFYVFCNLIYLIGMAGYFRLLSPGIGGSAYLSNSTTTLLVVASYIFIREFLDTRTQLPRADKLLSGLIVIFSALIFLIGFIPDLYSYLIAISVGIISPMLALAVAILSLRKGHPMAKYFLVAWATYLVSAGLWGWMWLGVIEPKEWVIWLYYIGTLLEVALLSVVLGFRFTILKKQAESLGADKTRYKKLSRTDELTGVLNRRGFMQEVERTFTKGHSGSLIWLSLDVDHFKRFNDSHGHIAGDKLLRKLGALLAQCSRSDDITGRLGGEEFALLLVGCPVDKAQVFTSRLLEQFATLSVTTTEGEKAGTTLSIGATEVKAREEIESVWRRADELLYEAKNNGRNQVIFG